MRYRSWIAVAALAALCGALFHPLSRFGYFAVDDTLYVAGNRIVQDGLSASGVAWAFTSVGYAGNWHPLTWLSLMLDVELFGAGPRGHHLVNILLHAVNAALVFTVLRSLTGAFWKSVLAAAIFAGHPVQVESVAWISERKDVLSAFFWLAVIAAHVRHSRSPGKARFIAVAGCLALGLMAKSMLVTLPFVLLLLDWWPLGRLCPRAGGAVPAVLEKVPLLALSAGSAVVTLLAQAKGGLMAPLAGLPFAYRLANAATAYVQYLGNLLWPLHLGFWYPHPGRSLPVGEAVGAGVFLALASAATVATARRLPFFAVGWFWFLGGLVPVIGLVQVGAQSMADRYTYLPLLGIVVAMVWGGAALAQRAGAVRFALWPAALLTLAGLSLLTRLQVETWRTSESVFTRALQVTSDNWVMHNNLGELYLEQDRFAEAATHFEEAARLMPRYTGIRERRALALAGGGRLDEAAGEYARILRRDPGSPSALYALGNILAQQGNLDRASSLFEQTIRRDPGHDGAHNNLAALLLRQGRTAEAVPHFREAVRLNPANAEARNNLGTVLYQQGAWTEALAQYHEAVRVRPGSVTAMAGLARTYRALGDREGAISWSRAVLRLDANQAEAAATLRELGR